MFTIYEKRFKTTDTTPLPLFVFHHGAGHSGASFLLLAEALQQRLPCDIILFDCRGHGTTFTDNDNDLSLSTLVHDISNIIAEYRKNATELILVGHSLGYSLY